MRTIIISLFFFCWTCAANAQKHYAYADNFIKVAVEWDKQVSDTDIVLITLEPLADILVLDNDGCFQVDTNDANGVFRNSNCPFYIVNQCANSIYKVLSKSTQTSYKWKVPKNAHLHDFAFEIEYIATTTKAYQVRRKKITKVLNADDNRRLSISVEDEKELLNKAYLKIEY